MSKHLVLKATAQTYLLSPEGEVDGLLLDGNRQLKTPPHMAKELTETVTLGSEIEVEVKPGLKSPHGQEFHFERWLKDDKQNLVAEGEIQHWLVDKEGELRGIILSDASQVHVPKHLRKEFTPQLKLGVAVRAQGRGFKTPHGTVLKAEEISLKVHH